MVATRRLIAVSSLFLSAALSAPAVRDAVSVPADTTQPVILVAIDGFRADYLKRFRPPVLTKLANTGVRAKWLIPSFPTKTFPNFYAIATGLYPENNGIVENNIWDFNTIFSLSNTAETQKSRWWFGEPIWVTAEKQSVRAATFFFPGSEAEIAGFRPSIWRAYDGTVSNSERVDTVLGWMDLPPAERPRFAALYFSAVDDAGHAYSPDADKTRDAVLEIDRQLGRLVDGVNARIGEDAVNIIVVSDHGMATVRPQRYVRLDAYFDFRLAERVIMAGEIAQIFPKPGSEAQIIGGLSKIKHVSCWRKAEIPAALRYRSGRRVAPIVCSAEVGWSMVDAKRLAEPKAREALNKIRGAHGYDNKAPEMRALFVANGPAFKRKIEIPPFYNIEIYKLMCDILGIRPALNDGTDGRLRPLLK